MTGRPPAVCGAEKMGVVAHAVGGAGRAGIGRLAVVVVESHLGSVRLLGDKVAGSHGEEGVRLVVVDLLLEGQRVPAHGLPVDGAGKVVGAVALILLKEGVVLGKPIAAGAQAGALEDVLRVAQPGKLTLESGRRVRLVSVMRRTVLNRNVRLVHLWPDKRAGRRAGRARF